VGLRRGGVRDALARHETKGKKWPTRDRGYIETS